MRKSFIISICILAAIAFFIAGAEVGYRTGVHDQYISTVESFEPMVINELGDMGYDKWCVIECLDKGANMTLYNEWKYNHKD